MMNMAQNQKGQGVVEAVLLLVVIVSVSMLVSNELQKRKFIQNLIAQPWSTLTGMIECGVWTGCEKGKQPNSINRNLSYKPDK